MISDKQEAGEAAVLESYNFVSVSMLKHRMFLYFSINSRLGLQWTGDDGHVILVVITLLLLLPLLSSLCFELMRHCVTFGGDISD